MLTDEDKEFIATLLTLGATERPFHSESVNIYILNNPPTVINFLKNKKVNNCRWLLNHFPVAVTAREALRLLKERINETQSTTGTDT